MHRPGPGMCVRDAEEETPRLYAARLRRKNRLAAAATTPRRAPVFDCLILEPCQPGLDPTFLIDGLGGRAIATAVNRLADWTRSRRTEDAAAAEVSLDRLAQLSAAEQIGFGAKLAHVETCVGGWLERLLADHGIAALQPVVVPYGSAVLGLATASSDVDLMAFVDCGATSYALIRLAAKALGAAPPPWIRPGSLSEVLQTAKAPVLSFDVLLGADDHAETSRSEELAEILSTLGIVAQGVGVAARPATSGYPGWVSVDLSFNDRIVVEETDLFRRTLSECPVGRLLLTFVKHWSKCAGVNEPKTGTLSSFGWRCIVLSVLIEQGAAPCLLDIAGNRPDGTGIGIGVSTGVPVATLGTAAAKLNGTTADGADESSDRGSLGRSTWPLLCRLSAELVSCVDGATVRLFQMATTDPAAVDQWWVDMSQPKPELQMSVPTVEVAGRLPGHAVDFVVLGLSHGSRKSAILHRLAGELGPPGAARHVSWGSSGPEEWEVFVRALLDAMAAPGTRWVLIKLVPDTEKLRKLRIFLAPGSRLVVFHDTAACSAQTDLWLFAQMFRVLQTQTGDAGRGGRPHPEAHRHVAVPEGLALYPAALSEPAQQYTDWANTVWKDEEHGIAQVFENLKKKQRKLSRLCSRIGADDSVVQFRGAAFYTAVPVGLWDQLKDVMAQQIRLLGSRRAALQRRSEVLALMDEMQQPRAEQAAGLVGTALGCERDLGAIVADLAAMLHQ